MSYSTLFVFDPNSKRVDEIEYGNSWVFSPTAWTILLEKYIPEEELVVSYDYRLKKSIIQNGGELIPKLNDIINNCDSMVDRTIWEITMQQVFKGSDAAFVSSSVIKFLQDNIDFIPLFDDTPVITERVKKRMIEMSNDIGNVKDNELFIHKNTSVDDTVEHYFNNKLTFNEYIKRNKIGNDFIHYADSYTTMTFTHNRDSDTECIDL